MKKIHKMTKKNAQNVVEKTYIAVKRTVKKKVFNHLFNSLFLILKINLEI